MAIAMVDNCHGCLSPSPFGKHQPTVDVTLSVDQVTEALPHMAARWCKVEILESKGTATRCAVQFIHHQT